MPTVWKIVKITWSIFVMESTSLKKSLQLTEEERRWERPFAIRAGVGRGVRRVRAIERDRHHKPPTTSIKRLLGTSLAPLAVDTLASIFAMFHHADTRVVYRAKSTDTVELALVLLECAIAFLVYPFNHCAGLRTCTRCSCVPHLEWVVAYPVKLSWLPSELVDLTAGFLNRLIRT